MNLRNKKIHMIGIGGIGMSGLAQLLAGMGSLVSGSDIEETAITKSLRRKGVRVSIGHEATNIKDQDLVVFSSCIRRKNPEILASRGKKIPVIPRTELLKMVMEGYKTTIAVTGTHGKTTITAMASFLLEMAGFDPTVLIGGQSPHFGGNAKLGNKKFLVAEVDESDGRFVVLRPTDIIMPNLEKEHVEHYRSEKEILKTFAGFIRAGSAKNTFFYHIEDANLRKLATLAKGKTVSFGFSDRADIHAYNVKTGIFKTEFDCFRKKKKIGRFTIHIPGAHNILNALAVISLGLKLGIDVNTIKRAILRYQGVKRRFEVIGEANGVKIVEDYAHHPTEVMATISAAHSLKPARLITVFQPHRYTRTKSLYKEFSDAFAGSDEVILAEVYSASEDKIKGAGSEIIYRLMKKESSIPVRLMGMDEIPGYLPARVRKGDLVLVLGAGDIGKKVGEIFERIKNRPRQSEFPKIKGRLLFNEPLSGHTTFRIGGPSKVWVEPENEAELKNVLRFANESGEKIFLIGMGSNILVADKGFRGIAIHLGSKFFKKVRVIGKKLKAGGGARLARLVDTACVKGLKGMEGLSGIPGTLGAAVLMNSGYRESISESLESIRVMDKVSGKVFVIKRKDIKFAYRHSGLDKFIVLEATLNLKKGDKSTLLKKRDELLLARRKEQPVEDLSAGSIFKNPPTLSAARCIDMLGMKGKKIGGAKISERHANFIVNSDNAKSEDVVCLMDLIKRRAKAQFNVDLVSEVRIIS